jgi:glycosyltransferase involved in cell wall biosynthesis
MKVSIIIPCYNHGMYLEEAIKSVEQNADNLSYEIIIINDGSTEETTINTLNELQQKGYTIIHQENQGLAAARNNGIIASSGTYIIPLDSDNKLHKNYLTKAISILDKRPDIDIVYGRPMFFGNEDGLREIGDFNFNKIIKDNYIDACAVFRRTIWSKTNGYDGKMPVMGHEDWEFWIHSFLVGARFFYLDKICFYYRVQPESMRISTTRFGFDANRKYIHNKHGIKIIEKLTLDHDRLAYIKNNRLKSIIKLTLGFTI